MGISEGIIPPHPAWKNGRWGFGASLSGDYGNDTAANLQKLSAGLITASDLISENGQTFEEVTRRQATEIQYMQRVASETGVPIELLTTRLSGATELLAAMNTPPPAPPAGLVEAGTDVKPMIDILKNVGEGVMDRESAIMALVQMYGLSRQEADKIVPDYNPPEVVAPPAVSKRILPAFSPMGIICQRPLIRFAQLSCVLCQSFKHSKSSSPARRKRRIRPQRCRINNCSK